MLIDMPYSVFCIEKLESVRYTNELKVLNKKDKCQFLHILVNDTSHPEVNAAQN